MADFLLENPELDRNEKIMLVCDCEEHLHELEILDDSLCSEAKRYTQKKYISNMSWEYTEERAQQLIEYVHKLLETVSEIELWRVWFDDKTKPVVYEIDESELNVEMIEKVFAQDYFKKPEGILIKKSIR